MSQWDGKTKGNLIGYKIFLYSIKILGVPFAYTLLKIVSYYYFLFSKVQKNNLIAFYTGALNLNEKAARRLAKKNFYKKGQTLIDRFAFLVGRGNKFTYDFENEHYLMEMREGGKGGILLSAHIGNWDTAGNLLKHRISSKINVVMLDAEVENIKKFLDNSTGGSLFNIIPLKDDLSHIFKINNALSNNEFVAIHADRYMEGSKYIEVDFFKKRAKFPMGPFLIASKFKAPVTFVYSFKDSDYHYALSATKPITTKTNIEDIAKKYVEELEKKVMRYPEQWFNYYNFYS